MAVSGPLLDGWTDDRVVVVAVVVVICCSLSLSHSLTAIKSIFRHLDIKALLVGMVRKSHSFNINRDTCLYSLYSPNLLNLIIKDFQVLELKLDRG